MKLAKALFLLVFMNVSAQDNYNLVVGTYTKNCESHGIYVYDFNAKTAEVKLKDSVETVNPSYLAVSPDIKNIYCVNEDGDKSSVSSFKYTAATGKIQLLNKKDSKGDNPCYIINDSKNVIVANYAGGSIAVFEKKDDGSLTNAKQVVKHSGSSVNRERQEGPHVHMVHFSPDGKYIFANDLGTDKIYIYNYNPDGDRETLILKETVTTKPGSGPRHLAFSPNGIFFYVLHELDASLTAYSFINGKVEKIQETTIEEPGFTGKNSAADIHLSRDGKFLYATNRGDANTISIFQIHANGRMNIVQQLLTGGRGPRNFVIGPKDNFLLIGHEETNDIMVFKRDRTTGMLTYTGTRVEVCSPVCLVFTEKQ